VPRIFDATLSFFAASARSVPLVSEVSAAGDVVASKDGARFGVGHLHGGLLMADGAN
jgi:hypothetical protein